MKVNMMIEPGTEKISMFKSLPVQVVIASIELTEEEKAGIAQLELSDYTLLMVPNLTPLDKRVWGGAEQRPVAVKAIVDASNSDDLLEFKYLDPVKAQNGMAELKQQLVNLKEMLGRAEAPNRESFEL